LVGVFDPENEDAVVPAGIEVVEKDGSDAAQMKTTGGTGCKTEANFSGHRLQR
jgi:hypothetical protein